MKIKNKVNNVPTHLKNKTSRITTYLITCYVKTSTSTTYIPYMLYGLKKSFANFIKSICIFRHFYALL